MPLAFAIVVAGALGLSMSLAANSQETGGAVTTARDDDGRRLFMTYCSNCHGRTGRGDGPAAETLGVRPANLTQLARATDGAFIAERIRRMIDGRDRYIKAHGSIDMPAWGDAFKRREGLSDQAIAARIDAIVKYLQSIQQRSG
jgi:mono/diheme cytochrome c family protein